MLAVGNSSRLTRVVTRPAWILRPTLWFTAASIVSVLLHELAHAVTAHAVGKAAEMHQYWVNWDWLTATVSQRAIVGVAGPVFSLALGLLCFVFYRKFAQSSAGLPLLFLSTIGVAIFFGNLMSMAFVGDFSNAATVLGLPTSIRYGASLIGAVSSAAVLFWQGRELRRWVPADAGRVFGAIGITAIPVIIGTAFIILINQPTPPDMAFASARVSEAAFELFAVAGAIVTRSRSTRIRFPLPTWIDAAVLIIAVFAVRVMAVGIPLAP
jgi:hypothetical protein